jgi:ABC-type Mn2+/Zn2+ transport system permease subunit
MKELLIVYWPNLLATVLFGTLLPFLGAHLVARGESVKMLSMSQAAGLGITIAMLFLKIFSIEQEDKTFLLPVLLGFLFSVSCFFGSIFIERDGEQNTGLFLSLFLCFWAITQALIGFFPAIEALQTNIYFGDIVTLTKTHSILFSLGATALIAYGLFRFQWLKQRTFDLAVLLFPWQWKKDFGFAAFSLLAVTFSIQFLGLLFTLSCLFLPTVMLSFASTLGVNLHIKRAMFIGGIASFIGFMLSLLDSRLLTTPTISILFVFLPLLIFVGPNHFFRCK